MIGMLLSFIKNWIWLTLTIVESLVFTVAFNYLAPRVNEIYLAASTWKLPFTHVRYWHVFAFIIVIHYLGQFVQNITPKFFYYNKTNSDKKE
jgi:hypothetical protein